MRKTTTLNNRIKLFEKTLDELIDMREVVITDNSITKAQKNRIVSNIESLAVYLNTQIKVCGAVVEGTALFNDTETATKSPKPKTTFIEVK